jgi:hypothetical protein
MGGKMNPVYALVWFIMGWGAGLGTVAALIWWEFRK